MPGTHKSGRKKKKKTPVFKPAKGRKPFDRQPGEGDTAFEAFCVYRDLGVSRSQKLVMEQLQKSAHLMGRWSTRWGWRLRVEAWDNEADKRKRKGTLKAIEDMQRRHIKQALQMQGLAALSTNKLIKKQQATEESILTADQIAKLADLGFKVERINLGEPESVTEVQGGLTWSELVAAAKSKK